MVEGLQETEMSSSSEISCSTSAHGFKLPLVLGNSKGNRVNLQVK